MIFPGSLKKSNFQFDISLAGVFVILNIVVYLFTNISFDSWPAKKGYQDFQNIGFNQAIGQMYLQTLDNYQKKTLSHLDPNKLAQLAIKDQFFWSKSAAFPFTGDVLQINSVKAVLGQLKSDYQTSVQHQLGLGQTATSPWAWVTYQFTHFSFMHLFSNLIFIFMVIAYLEKKINVGWICTVYLLGGIGGGISFLIFSQNNDLSVIGASGSVCALLSFLVVIKKNTLMPWTYFFAPIPGGYGEIYLPAFLILPIYLVADFTSMLWEPSGVSSSIAHSAHIGGTIAGLGLGVVYLLQNFFRREATSHGIFSDDDGLNELP